MNGTNHHVVPNTSAKLVGAAAVGKSTAPSGTTTAASATTTGGATGGGRGTALSAIQGGRRHSDPATARLAHKLGLGSRDDHDHR